MTNHLKVFFITSILFLALCPVTFAKFIDFPYTLHKHDISVNYSEKGSNYIKIIGYFGQTDNSMIQYQLLSKSYDLNENLMKFDSTSLAASPVFHFQRRSMTIYEFCIVSLDLDNNFISSTNIQKVSPFQFIKNKSLKQRVKSTESRDNSESESSAIEMTYEIDHQSFPYINLLAQITLNGIPFDGSEENYPLLETNNFQVYEDDRYQPIRDLLPPEPQGYSKIADIVIIHDDSGSLDDEAAQVKSNINSFVENLVDSGIDYRIGLLPYGGDGGFSTPNGTILHNGILSSSTDTLLSDVNSMRFDGGTENAFCALRKAVDGIIWRPSTQKVVILITDEPHDGSNCDTSESEITELLVQSNIVVYGLTRGAGEFNRIAEATKGAVYNITTNFNTILSEIGADIVAKYIIQYESDNTLLDGSDRTVDLNVWALNDQNEKIEKSLENTYAPRPPINIQLTSETHYLSELGQRNNKALSIVALITQGKTTNWDNITAKLYYQNQNVSYQTVNMTHIGSGLFQAVIPAEDVVDPYIHYYISSTDGTVRSTLPSVDPADNSIVIAVLPNFSPTITHTPVVSANEGDDINIRARIEDATNIVSKAQLFFRKNGEYNYRTISISASDSIVEFNATIPKDSVTANGIEYYLYAEDDFGVNTTFGTPDDPIEIFVASEIVNSGQKDIGNITVYADSFKQDSTNTNIWLASGNVSFGTKLGASKLISSSTSLQMDYDTKQIQGISSGNLTALKIKRNEFKGFESIPLYSGTFKIDCVPLYPILTMVGGESKLRLIGNMQLLYPYADNQITIQDDQLVVHDVNAHITQAFDILLTIGDIVLSQKGATMNPIKISSSDLLKAYPLSLNKNWKLANMEFEIDLFREYIKASGEFSIDGVIDGGLGATIGFLMDPFAIETIGGKLVLPGVAQRFLTIPPTPPSPLGVRITGGAFVIDNITSSTTGLTGLKLQGTCSAVLVDALNIAESFNDTFNYQIITGDLALLIDLSGKAELSGQIKLLEHLKLASAKMGFGNPSYLSGNINIMNTLIGSLYLQFSTTNNCLAIVGKNQLTLQIPTQAKWIGGYKLSDIANDATIRLSRSGIDQADFRSSYKLFFIELAIRLDVSNPKNPDLYITGWDKTIQVFRKRTKRDANEISFTIDKNHDQIIVKIDSETVAPLFTITFPDNTIYTPENASAEALSSGVSNIFFMRNVDAHEAYYAINQPPLGNYQLNITNKSEIGEHNLHILGPNAKPEIEVTSFSSDVIWDGINPVDITWNAYDADDNAKISLYYDNDKLGNNGSLIVADILEDSGQSSYQWEISENMQPGNYFIYAKIDDYENVPVYVYSDGSIFIENNQAPTCPANVQVMPLDGEIKVQWDAIQDTNLAGYRVYLNEYPRNSLSEHNFATGIQTSIVIPGLVNANEYEVEVSAVNTSGYESVRSTTQHVQLKGTATGGTPDLEVNLVNSSLSIVDNANALDEKLRIFTQIDNIGDNDSYSADIFCYFGTMAPENLIEQKRIAGIEAGNNIQLSFETETAKFANRLNERNIIIKIDNVSLSELNSDNNIGIIVNDLTFQIDQGISLSTLNGKTIKIFLLEGHLKTFNAIDPVTITTTQNRPDNLPYGLLSTQFETSVGGTAQFRIQFPEALSSNVKWFKFMDNQWYEYSNVAFNKQRTEATITLYDGGDGDDDGISNGIIVDPAGPGSFRIEEEDDDSNTCFISIL